MQLIYLIIYNRYINFFLRWINKGFGYFFPLNFKIPPSGVIQLRSGQNRFKLATNQTSYLTQRLFWYGMNSFEYTDIFSRLIRKMDVFFDVGSNIGYYTILACSVNDKIKVHSFEPARGAAVYLKKNVNINNIEQRVQIEEIALSDSADTLMFHEVENDKYRFTRHILSGESNASTKNLDREYKAFEVASTTLDEYCEKNDITSIDLIKIDTEGAEYSILKGAEQTISTSRPIIVCEILFDFNEGKIESVMRSHGYEFYLYKENSLKKVGTLLRSNDDGVRDCFLVHPDRYSLIEEYCE
jgi:FkbM family methyltransferase